jgi:hypothetical protein
VLRGLSARMLRPWQLVVGVGMLVADTRVVLARRDRRWLGDLMAGTALVEAPRR